MNISNTETEKFTQEVAVLRKYGILESFRTSEQAKTLLLKPKRTKKVFQDIKLGFHKNAFDLFIVNIEKMVDTGHFYLHPIIQNLPRSQYRCIHR